MLFQVIFEKYHNEILVVVKNS